MGKRALRARGGASVGRAGARAASAAPHLEREADGDHAEEEEAKHGAPDGPTRLAHRGGALGGMARYQRRLAAHLRAEKGRGCSAAPPPSGASSLQGRLATPRHTVLARCWPAARPRKPGGLVCAWARVLGRGPVWGRAGAPRNSKVPLRATGRERDAGRRGSASVCQGSCVGRLSHAACRRQHQRRLPAVRRRRRGGHRRASSSSHPGGFAGRRRLARACVHHVVR